MWYRLRKFSGFFLYNHQNRDFPVRLLGTISNLTSDIDKEWPKVSSVVYFDHSWSILPCIYRSLMSNYLSSADRLIIQLVIYRTIYRSFYHRKRYYRPCKLPMGIKVGMMHLFLWNIDVKNPQTSSNHPPGPFSTFRQTLNRIIRFRNINAHYI